MAQKRLFRTLVPAGSRRDRALWMAWLALRKLREGPGPWFRAVRHGVYQLLPGRLQDAVLALTGRRPRRGAGADLRGAGADLRGAGEAPGLAVPGRVTVVLPVYQQATLLGDAVDSALAQTWPDLELIVLDDGSGPAVGELLARYRGRPRLRVLRQPNQGLPKALSSAFEFATGEFFCWTSADNLMGPRQLERLVGFLRQRPEVAMVYADYEIIGADGAPLRGTDFRVADRRGPDDCHVRISRSTRNLAVVRDNFIGPCFVYRGAVGRLLGDYNPELGLEDYDYWLRLNRLFRIEHLGSDEVHYRYRVHEDSLSGRARELRIYQRGVELLEHERQRAVWCEAPTRLLADAGAQAWLQPLAGADPLQALVPGAPWPADGQKTLAVCDGAALPAVLPAPLPAHVAVAAHFARSEDVYRAQLELGEPGVVAFGGTPAVTARLGLFTRTANTAAPGPESLGLAKAFCANSTFFRATRSPAALARAVPQPVWPAAGGVLLQVDAFAQGGLEQVVLDLIAGLGQRGRDVSLLVTGRAGPEVERARRLGARVLTLARADDEDAYAEALRRSGCAAVSAHDSVVGARVAAGLGIPFVQVLHNTYVWFDPARIAAYREAEAHTAAYAAVSARVLAYADLRLGLDVRKALVLPNGIDLDRGGPTTDRAALRRQHGIAADDFVFLQVASIYPAKAQRLAVHALARLRHTVPGARLLLLGRTTDARYGRVVAADAERLDVADCVTFAGHHDDPRRCYGMADALLLPSFWEGCSLAVLEALRHGLPLVLSDVGAAREQLRWGRGELVPAPGGDALELDWSNVGRVLDRVPEDFVVALAEAMARVAALPADAARSAATLAAWDRRRMAAGHEALLAWLLQGGEPAALRAPLLRAWRQGDTVAAAETT